MNGKGNFSKDPLDLARNQMDFARMAADAPTSKEILFKAQTIIPATPAKPLWKKAAPAAGAAVLAGMLFVPMLPDSSQLGRLDVSFEGSMQRSEAQAVEFEIRRSLDSDILMGSSFSGSDDAGSGQLRLSFSSAGEPRLSSTVEQAVNAAASDRAPLFGRLAVEAETSERDSILERAMSAFSGKSQTIEYVDPSNASARELLANPELLRNGLNSALEADGYRISQLEFLDRQAQPAAEGADFRHIELPCWPRPLAIQIDAVDMAEFEHNEIRRSCLAWLDSVNLSERKAGLADRPGELLPIVVEVIDPDGFHDRVLTDRLQALIEQPSPAQFTDTSSWSPKPAMDRALAELMQDNRDYPVSWERMPDPAYNRDVNFFWATVRLSNSTEKQPEVDQRVKELEEAVDSSQLGF